MDDLILVARIAGERVALPAGAVQSVIEVEAIAPVPRAARHVAGLAALRSRVLTVIDTRAALGLPCAVPPPREAVVTAVDGHLYALLVDEVEDVAPRAPLGATLPSGIGAGWAAAAIGLVEHDARATLLLDPARLVTGCALAAT